MSLKKILFSFLALTVTVTLLFSVFGLGYLTSIRRIKRVIDDRQAAWKLGNLANEKKIQSMATAYLNPTQAENDLKTYAWDCPGIALPFVGSGPRPGDYGNLHITPLHFRGKTDPTSPKPEGVFRIFVTGGSTAFGVGAPSDETTIPSFLEEFLKNDPQIASTKKIEVFNAAFPAWASTQERLLITNRLIDMEPDLIVSLTGNNDAHWAYAGENVLDFHTYLDAFYWEIVNLAYEAALFGRITPRRRGAKEPLLDTKAVGSKLERNVIGTKAILSQEKIPWLYALQPNIFSTQKNKAPHEEFYFDQSPKEKRQFFMASYQEIRNKMAKQSSGVLTFIDLTGMFDEEDENIFLDSYHFGDKGNEKIAEKLAGEIKTRFIFSQ